MKSLKTLQIALFALLLVLLALAISDIFTPPRGVWIEAVLAALIVVLSIWLGKRRIAMRRDRTLTVKKTRDSLLKWRWEERNRREW
jgi:membrane protein implicated in regulation of membrane protease activity